MEFTNTFRVPVPVDQAWTMLMDVERIAPCLPGAKLTEMVDATTFKGQVAIRLGPMSFTFAGTARFEDRDDDEHTAVVRASGKDAKGRGGAQAIVHFDLSPDGNSIGTRVKVHTALQLSGSVAQFGRSSGIIADVATQLIGQFETRLGEQLAGSAPRGTAFESLSPERAAVLHRDEPLVSSALPPAVAEALATASGPPHPAAQQPVAMAGILLRALWRALLGPFSALFGR
jgi:uncharacterized protein